MSDRCSTPITLGDAVDYWAGDLPPDVCEHVEQHMFACDACAARIADVASVAAAVGALIRAGRFHATVTDAVLNRLSRDGLRLRSYSIDPGQIVPCAVWSDDDLIVSRLRADLSGVESLAATAYGPDGRQLARLTDVPVREGQTEVITAISASAIRQLPAGRVRFTLAGSRGGNERVLGEYVFEHEGTAVRSAGSE